MNGPIRIIVEIVAAQYEVSATRLLGRELSRVVTLPRQVAMYLAFDLTGRSYFVIGRVFGRHHTTVMQGVRAVRYRMADDPQVRAEVAVAREKCRAAVGESPRVELALRTAETALRAARQARADIDAAIARLEAARARA